MCSKIDTCYNLNTCTGPVKISTYVQKLTRVIILTIPVLLDTRTKPDPFSSHSCLLSLHENFIGELMIIYCLSTAEFTSVFTAEHVLYFIVISQLKAC